MMKRILSILILLIGFTASAQIQITTTSNSGNWSPFLVTNSGNQLTWTAAANGDFAGQVVNADDPTFDFSTNVNNNPITITITNVGNDFSGLTELDFWNDNGTGSDITDIDISQATALTLLNLRYNYLTTLDISQNTELETLIIRGNRQLSGQALNTSANTKLTSIRIDVSGITSVDFSNNTLLTSVLIYNAKLTTEVLDQVLIDLDANGQNGGDLQVAGNTGQLSYNSYNAYNSLIAKSWTIDVPAPPSGPNTETITLLTTSNQAGWTLGRFRNTGLIPHWKAEGTGITTQEFDEHKPVFDFSSNTGNSVITITITSNDGFDYLDEMSLYIDFSVNSGYSDIFSVDLDNANNLNFLYPNRSNLNTIDVSSLVNLQRLLIHGGNKQLSSQTNALLDISSNPDLYQIFAENTFIQSLSSLSNNPLIRDIDLRNSEFTSIALDQILIDLDNNGITNPPPPQVGTEHIKISGNPGSLTSASYTAYNNLITKGWTIDVPAPPAAPGADINITGNGNSIPGNGTNTPSPTDDTDFGSTAAGTVITKTFTIENLGDQPLNLTGNPDLVAISGTNAADFTISALPVTPIAVGASATFDVTFNANSLGVRTAVITVESDDPDEASYTFNIQAESTQALGPEINVTGNNISIPSGNTPIIADGTDFGQVQIGSPVTHTFTIENLGDSDLLITYFYSNSTNYFNFVPPGGGNITLTPGTSTDIVVTFDPLTTGVQTGTITIGSTDADEPTYVVNLTAEGVPASSGTIDVQGNGISIANGDTTPDIADDTNFGQVLNNTTKTVTYTINNAGTTDLTISGISLLFGSDPEFSISNDPSPATITPGNSVTFDVTFSPITNGNYSANVQIDNSDTGSNPFNYVIAGEGADVVISGDIMITQYYENASNDGRWIEVKNISGAPISAGTYFLALYNETAIPGIDSNPPTASEPIPALATDEVILFHGANTLPPLANINPAAQQISTAVCNFDGNDVILISTTADATCYANRQDIIGTVPTSSWGADISLIRGGNSSESPEADFNLTNWLSLSPNDDVDNADIATNIALGTQGRGPTIWDGSSWSNENDDKTRTVYINGPYTASNGNIEAYNLIINSGIAVDFDSGTTNSVVVENDLTIDGSLTIGDQESLVLRSETANINGVITKLENSTFRNNTHDFTYWSSPISNATIENTFTGVTPNRIFRFDANLQVSDPNDPNYFAPWIVATGLMTPGRGYIAEGVAGTTGIHSISFTGTPNNGIVQFDVYFNNDGGGNSDLDNDFNLVGNPYPAAIDIRNFLLSNSDKLDPIVYLWTHNTPISGGNSGDYTNSDYAYYNFTGGSWGGANPNDPGKIPNNNIGSSQGFFVRAVKKGLIQFRNEMLLANANDQFFKSDKKKNQDQYVEDEQDRIWLNLTSNEQGYNQILIGFLPEATDDIDFGYDARKFKNSGNPISFYSVLNNEKFAIQGLGIFDESKTISLGFDTKNSPRTFTISIAVIQGQLKNADIYLVDNLLGVTHDLKQSNYTFEQTEAGEFPNRFTLQFTQAALGVDDFTKDIDFRITNAADGFKINASKTVKDVKVYDLLGRVVLQAKPNKQSFTLSADKIKPGTVLIFKTTFENGAELSKKTIRY